MVCVTCRERTDRCYRDAAVQQLHTFRLETGLDVVEAREVFRRRKKRGLVVAKATPWSREKQLLRGVLLSVCLLGRPHRVASS